MIRKIGSFSNKIVIYKFLHKLEISLNVIKVIISIVTSRKW